MAKNQKEIIAKGFLKALSDAGDIMAERTKLQTDIMGNEFKAKQNFFWKMKEEQAKTQQTMDLIKQMTGQGGGEGDLGVAPYGQGVRQTGNWGIGPKKVLPYSVDDTDLGVGPYKQAGSEKGGMRLKGATVGGLTFETPNPREERLSKNMIFANSTKLRQEFINRPEVKEYININTQVRSMDSLLKKAKEGNIQNKVALDQGLITMYNKLTDPNSVVRESEYARTPQNLPLVNRFSGALQKLEKGGAGLTNADREALVWGAKVIANERGRTYNDTLQGYIDLAGQNYIDIGLVTRGLNPHSEYELGGTGGNVPNTDIKTKYNLLREKGISTEEAKSILGL